MHAEKSGKYYHRSNFISAYVDKKPIAPMFFFGTCNTQLFNDWVSNVLLKELKPGQVVIMDNASFHKSSKTKNLIESVGCRLVYLSPYSPDLNPIEKFWANMKRFVKNQRPFYKSILSAAYGFFGIGTYTAPK